MLKDLNTMAVLPATDLTRASNFYRNVLQLDSPESMDEESLFFHSGNGTVFLLYRTDNAGSAKNTAMAWETSDIEGDMANLRSRGVEFEDYDFPGLSTENGLVVMPLGKAAWFTDTEGNILNLFQRG